MVRLILSEYASAPTLGSDHALPPNVGGNRRAALALAEDQGMNRRVRLTVRLGVMLHSWTAASA